MELLVIIVIIGILVGLLFPVLIAARETTRKSKARVEIRELERACMMYKQANGSYPFPNGDVNVAAVNILSGASGGIKYMDFKKNAFNSNPDIGGFRDPWGNPYKVRFDADEDVTTRWTYKTRVRCVNAKTHKY